ncbi:hypothetical protein SK128_023399 [Halocaridina rubra]|uniref:Uncharacterized protein n=1 Tax=Halocaridina rubra TaxID=373956 RepID=A0AAN8WAY7_HALRR
MEKPDENVTQGAIAPAPKITTEVTPPSRGVSFGATTIYGHSLQKQTLSSSMQTLSSTVATAEPVSILGKGRHYSGGSGPSVSPRPTVKFSDSDGSSFRDRTPDSPRYRILGQESPKFKIGETFKYKSHEGSSLMTQRSTTTHTIGSISETSTYSVSETSSSYGYTSESSKLVGTSYRCPDSPRSKKITRTPHRNSIIASMELKVPSFHELGAQSSGSVGSGLTPILGHPESRGLTILSPHNPTPELHFSSTFTVRTRKGKTIVLPKLRIPAFHSHSHDSIFLGEQASSAQYQLSSVPAQLSTSLMLESMERMIKVKGLSCAFDSEHF